MPDFAYDHPQYVTRQTAQTLELATTGTSGFVRLPSDSVVTRVSFCVTTAGTATAGAYILQAGTTAIGTATLGTTAAAGGVTLDNTNTTVAAGTAINFVRSGTDSTGRAVASIEFYVAPLAFVG